METRMVRFKSLNSLNCFKEESGANLEIGRNLGLRSFEVIVQPDGYLVHQDYISKHIGRYITIDEFDKYIETVPDGNEKEAIDVTIVKTLTINTPISKDNWEEVVRFLDQTFGG